MDKAIIIAPADSLRQHSVGKTISALEHVGFQVEDLMIFRVGPSDFYRFCSAADDVPTAQTVDRFAKGSALIMLCAHKDIPTAFKRDGVTLLLNNHNLLLYQAQKTKVSEFWFGRAR